MQKSTLFISLALLVIFGAAYWKFAFAPGPVPTQRFVVTPTSPLFAPPGRSDGAGGSRAMFTAEPTESPEEDAGVTIAQFGGGNAAGGGGGETFTDAELEIDQNFKDQDPQRCMDMSGEENPNLQVLIHRLKKFRFNYRMARQVWGDVHVFTQPGLSSNSTTSSASSSSAPANGAEIIDAAPGALQYPPLLPPVMRQFLYCYTHDYIGNDTAAENGDCLAEMAGLDAPVNRGNYFVGSSSNDLKACTAPPIYQGNVTRWADLAPVVTQFPGPLAETERTLAAIAESRRWYWKAMPDPFKFTCPTCTETKNLIAPSFLVGTRRWFPIQNWYVMTGAADSRVIKKLPYQCLVFMEGGWRTAPNRGLDTQCSGKSEPKAGDVNEWSVHFSFSEILDIAFAVFQPYPLEDAFFSFSLMQKDGTMATHFVQPQRPLYGCASVWQTLQMLYGFDIPAYSSSSSSSSLAPPRRALFSTRTPLVVRNITNNITAMKHCLPPALMAPRNMDDADPANKRWGGNKFAAIKYCWTQLISTSTYAARSKKPIFYHHLGSSSSNSLTYMEPTQRFPYLPCYPPYTTALLAHARKNKNVDSHDVFWPYVCHKLSHRRGCLDAKIAAMLRLKPSSPLATKAASADGLAPDPAAILKNVRMSDLVKPRVAVCMAGFLRSFHLSRHAIFQNLVDPYNADFFASTWNVQGRAKKTLIDSMPKGHILNVDRMRRRLLNLIPRDRNVTKLLAQGRYKVTVFSWNLYRQTLNDFADIGWRHAGLYMLLSHAVQSSMDSGRTYDIVIRGRFDLVPLAPLIIYPVWATPDRARRNVILGEKEQAPAAENGNADSRRLAVSLATDDAAAADAGDSGGASDNNSKNKKKRVASWLLDTGSACEMDGFWWPRTAVLRQGVVVTHTADTRFKLFSWQFCDWLHIGTFETMSVFSKMSGWALDNYVDSGAQFVEHVFAIDQGIRYVPMQLYLKVLRETRKKKKGSKPAKYRVRMHLFG